MAIQTKLTSQQVIGTGIVMVWLWLGCAVGHSEVKKIESRTMHVHATIEPIFLVEVAARSGGETIEFGTLSRAGAEPVEAEPVQVDISVVSNLGVPYQITQKASHLLTNEEGVILPQENFRVQTSETKHGKGKILTPEAVTNQDHLLFESNEQGLSDRFTAAYSLTIPPTQPGGDYRTDIVYTIVTRE